MAGDPTDTRVLSPQMLVRIEYPGRRFSIALYREAFWSVGGWINNRFLTCDHFSNQLSRDGPHGETLMAMAEGEPEVIPVRCRADHGQHIRQAWPGTHPGRSLFSCAEGKYLPG